MKPRKGLSFFLKTETQPEQVAFCVVLSAKSDEDGEYKIVRTHFTDNKGTALNLPLSEMGFYHFEEDVDDGLIAEEWDTEAVRSLTRKSIVPPRPSTSKNNVTRSEPRPEIVEAQDEDLEMDEALEDVI